MDSMENTNRSGGYMPGHFAQKSKQPVPYLLQVLTPMGVWRKAARYGPVIAEKPLATVLVETCQPETS